MSLDTYIQEAAVTALEMVADQIELFNEASDFALALDNEVVQGSFKRKGLFQGISDARRSIDMNAANGDVTATKLTRGEMVSVKLAGGHTVELDPKQQEWIGTGESEAINAVAEGFSQDIMEHIIHDALQAAVTCCKVGGAKETVTGELTQRAINASFRKFGASASQIKTTFMSGVAANDLQDSMLANAENLYSHGDVTVLSVLGKKVVAVDAPALTDGTKDIVLSLVPYGVTVSHTTPHLEVNAVTGKARPAKEMQSFYEYTIGVKGYSWDLTRDVVKDSAAMAVQANFKQVATSIKNTAGVIVEVTPSA